MTFLNANSKPLVLLFHLLVMVLYHQFGYIGHYGYDDLQYAEIAYKLNQGIVDFGDHFTFRFPVILFTSLSYLVFGINDFASSIPALIITSIVLFLVYQLLKSKSTTYLSLGLSFTLFNHWFIFYSDKLMSDMYIVLAVVSSLFTLHQYFYSENKNTTLYAFLLGFSLLFGFSAKGTIVLIVPLLGYLFLTDIISHRNKAFWIQSALFTCGLLLVYFVFIGWLTGDVFARFKAIANNSYLNPCSYDQQPTIFLIKRIAYEFFKQQLDNGLLIGFLFIIPLWFQKNIKEILLFKTSNDFILVSAFILLLSSNFMTISFSSYVPMCLDPRHYLYLVPIAALLAPKVIVEFYIEKKHTFTLLFFGSLITLYGFLFFKEIYWDLYLPIFILLLIPLLVPTIGEKHSWLISLFFAIVLFIKPFKMILYAQDLKYNKQKEIVIKQLIEKDETCFVVTDDVEKRFSIYYQQFNNTTNCKFINFDEAKTDTLEGKKVYLLKNWHTNFITGRDEDDIPAFARNENLKSEPIFKSEKPNIIIYDISKSFEVKTLLIKSINNFESDVEFWDFNPASIVSEKTHNGAKANLFNEYSATFRYATDSLKIDNSQQITVSVQAAFLSPEKTDTKLVIQLADVTGNTYIWQSTNTKVKAYNNWAQTTFDLLIPTKTIKPNSTLSVYLWTTDNKKSYVDDIEVSIHKQ